MVIAKLLKLYMFYSIFMALYYVVISMSIFTFKVCWEVLCSEPLYFSGTIQLIHGASQLSGFCMVWVFTVKNIRADYRFCCSNINILSCLQYLRRILANGLISSLLRCQLVSMDGGEKSIVSLMALHQMSFPAHMSEFLKKCPILIFLMLV